MEDGDSLGDLSAVMGDDYGHGKSLDSTPVSHLVSASVYVWDLFNMTIRRTGRKAGRSVSACAASILVV